MQIAILIKLSLL